MKQVIIDPTDDGCRFDACSRALGHDRSGRVALLDIGQAPRRRS